MADFKTFTSTTSNSPAIRKLLSELPKKTWFEDFDLYKWKNYWYFSSFIEGTLAFQSHYDSPAEGKPPPIDVLLTSAVKTGTTWLKALVPTIMGCCVDTNNDGLYTVDENLEDPLLKNHPHILVKSLDCGVYIKNPRPDFSAMPSPRIFHTHLPYSSIPKTITNSDCKMIYVSRDPKDALISLWHFVNSTRKPEQGTLPFQEPFEQFCDGVSPFGPFWDHVLGYWNESLKNPKRILFLKYEDLKKDPKEQVKILASFLGKPLANDAEVEKVIWRCSLERLKSLDVNKEGMSFFDGLSNSAFFRLGDVGDWKSNFTPEMAERIDEITRSKLEGSGLSL